jgi:hypothetical protein
MNVLRKLWLGLYSLPITFWDFYVFGYFIVARLLLFVLASWLLKSAPQLHPALAIFGQCIDVVYLPITSGGVWRSADVHKAAVKLTVGFSKYEYGWGTATAAMKART